MSSPQKARHVISNEVRNLLTQIKNDLAFMGDVFKAVIYAPFTLGCVLLF
ncbi:hypothetical protein Cabys_3367 [Caldithrix abyssi DSM 13497]|uniref:Uncharacterized protein n=1 Tax=Caldithrix abyssi DSM 13497 TaxID=880073 RepID=A0A1J1CBM7_CALAY|nr:hypothetical protein Cabys_3367 [Caldithrix abyssi DSM 13497]